MGTVKTAIQLRMQRARALVADGAVQSNGHVQMTGEGERTLSQAKVEDNDEA